MYLKLQPYKQSTLAYRSNFKLAPIYYGPYEVLAKIGTVAYQLKLPVQAQIHDVFHVSPLKKKLGAHAILPLSLPQVHSDGRPKMVPFSVLQQRMVKYKKETNKSTAENNISTAKVSL